MKYNNFKKNLLCTLKELLSPIVYFLTPYFSQQLPCSSFTTALNVLWLRQLATVHQCKVGLFNRSILHISVPKSDSEAVTHLTNRLSEI